MNPYTKQSSVSSITYFTWACNHIVDIIRKNATVDWIKRSDVRTKLRLTVRKILMKYGYPPDLAKMEADRVIEQSELLAETLT